MAKNSANTIVEFTEATKRFIQSLLQLEDKKLGKKQREIVLTQMQQVVVNTEISMDHISS